MVMTRSPGLEFIRAALDDFAAALEAGDGRQLRFDAVDALDVVDIGRVDGSVEHLEANLLRLELLGWKLSEPDDFIGLAEGGEGGRGGGRHASRVVYGEPFFVESCFL